MTNPSGICILCIGSDPINLNLRCSRLKAFGWKVISSGSGYGGLFQFAKVPVDCVVLDLNDRGEESALIAGQLKKQKPSLPVVMLVKSREGLSSGATDQADVVVLKSEEKKALLPHIQQLLNKTQA